MATQTNFKTFKLLRRVVGLLQQGDNAEFDAISANAEELIDEMDRQLTIEDWDEEDEKLETLVATLEENLDKLDEEEDEDEVVAKDEDDDEDEDDEFEGIDEDDEEDEEPAK